MKRVAIMMLIALCHVRGMAQDKSMTSRIDSLIGTANYEEAKKLISPYTMRGDATSAAFWSNRSAELTMMEGKLDAAENELLKINAGGDPFVEAITKTNLGFLYLNKARNDLALENLQQALALYQNSGKRNTLEAAKCLANLGLLYWSTGKLAQARENGLMALRIRQELTGENSEDVAASYNDLGLDYAQSDADRALEYYEKALAVYEKIHNKQHPKIAIANTNIGFMYRQMKLYGDAINNFENAESIWKGIYPGGHPNQALALVNLGITYEEMGDKKAARGYFERALGIYKKSYGDKHPDISFVLNQMGVLNLRDNKYTDAAMDFQDAICANSIAFQSRNLARNPEVNAYYNGKNLLYSLRLKAQALEGRHFGQTLRFEDLVLALNCLQSCDTLIDDIRYHSSDESDKIELGATANEVYEDGVRIADAMSEMSVHARKYREIAFYFAEKSKAAVLQESIADAEAKSFAGIPAELMDEEKGLKASMAMLSQKLAQKPGADEERILREQEFDVNRRYEAFTQRLETNYPEYFNLKFNRVAPTVADLQKLAGPTMAILSYFIAEKNQRLYTFLITSNKFKVFDSALPTDFDKTIKGFNNSLYFTVEESYRASAAVLSKLLLHGIPASQKELVIIPAGRLSTIPFEALSIRKMRTGYDFSEGGFLIERAGISYAFSAGLLLQKSRADRQQEPSIFLCAPIDFPVKDNLADLPGTENEVNNIAGLFPHNNLVVKHADASEALVKSGKLSDYKYLHFATHGVVDEISPELSRIFLQPGSADDGNVFSGEIFNLKLNADLAVLSACQTGLGKYSKGEGVIGLSRALVYAGARSIIVSYWSVADESTSDLMTDFYSELLKQPAPNYRTALQRSKVTMIRNKKYSAPYYWAPFVLIGF